MLRDRLLICCSYVLTAAGLAVAFSPAAAQQKDSYPSRPIRLIVAYSPGGGNDIVARLVAPQLGSAFGQQVIVDNRAGAGGTLGAALVARAEPDGYTMLVSSLGTHAVAPNLFKNPGYDPVKDFEPVTLLANTPIVLVVNKTLPDVDSVQALIALAKAKPNTVRYASGGFGAPPHTAAAVFETMTGIRMQHVPYKGAVPAITDLLGGRIQVFIGAVNSLLPHIKDGKLKQLAGAGGKRFAAFPDLPAIAETVPGVALDVWLGVFMPAGTPKDVVARVNADIGKVLGAADVKATLAAQGIEPAFSTPDALAATIRDDHARWGKVIRDANIKAD